MGKKVVVLSTLVIGSEVSVAGVYLSVLLNVDVVLPMKLGQNERWKRYEPTSDIPWINDMKSTGDTSEDPKIKF